MTSYIDEETGEVLPARELVGYLKDYVALRRQRDLIERELRRLGDLLKAYLVDHPGEELYDGELGIRARLQERTGTESYDVTSMPVELVHRLHEARLLAVDVKVLRALEGKDILPVDLKRYRIPGGLSHVLDVRQER